MIRTTYKEKVKKYFHKHVWLRYFQKGDLVLRRFDGPKRESMEEKMATNWEGPYRIAENLKNGANRLETINGKNLPRMWNSSYCKKYSIQIV